MVSAKSRLNSYIFYLFRAFYADKIGKIIAVYRLYILRAAAAGRMIKRLYNPAVISQHFARSFIYRLFNFSAVFFKISAPIAFTLFFRAKGLTMS